VVAEVTIFCESLRVVSHRAVFASEWKIKTRRRRNRSELERRGDSQCWIDKFWPRQFWPQSKPKRHNEADCERGDCERNQSLHRSITNGHELTRTTNNLLFLVSIGVYSWLMKVLVTGGAGFIGSHLVEKLLAAGHDVEILDDFNDFYDPQIKRQNIAGFLRDVVVHDVDLRNNDTVRDLFRRQKFEVIAHLAARAGVRPSIQQPQ